MKNVYTIPENERENVLKLLTRYSKKAVAYGQPLGYEMGEPYATEISVYETDYDTSQRKKVGTRMVEAFDLTIDGEIICKEGYMVAAKIEHLDGGNIVYMVAGNEADYPIGIPVILDGKLYKSVYSFWLGRPVYLLDQPDGFQKSKGDMQK